MLFWLHLTVLAGQKAPVSLHCVIRGESSKMRGFPQDCHMFDTFLKEDFHRKNRIRRIFARQTLASAHQAH
jgi:hypothetical protein